MRCLVVSAHACSTSASGTALASIANVPLLISAASCGSLRPDFARTDRTLAAPDDLEACRAQRCRWDRCHRPRHRADLDPGQRFALVGSSADDRRSLPPLRVRPRDSPSRRRRRRSLDRGAWRCRRPRPRAERCRWHRAQATPPADPRRARPPRSGPRRTTSRPGRPSSRRSPVAARTSTLCPASNVIRWRSATHDGHGRIHRRGHGDGVRVLREALRCGACRRRSAPPSRPSSCHGRMK